MKIAIFSDNFYPQLSGITDSVTLLGKALEERGHKIMFVAPRYSKKDYEKANLPRELLFVSDTEIFVKRLFSVAMPNSPTGQSRIVIPFGKSIFDMMKFKPDVIYTNSPFGTGIEALISSKILKIPLVGTNHTPIGEFMMYSPFYSKSITNLALRYFSWYYNRCKIITAPCQSLIEEMKSFGFKKNALRVPNPIDLGRFTKSNSEEQEELKKKICLSGKIVLYTGRLAPEKKVDVIIKAIAIAIKKIPDVRLVITGHGSALPDLKKIASELNISDKIIFSGFVDEANFPLYYKASDLFVIMSKAESQSLSLMQAMASGLPVIGANARALPEYISEETGLLVEPDNETKLAEAIITILEDKNLSEKMSENGPKEVKKFAPLQIAKIWEDIYNGALK